MLIRGNTGLIFKAFEPLNQLLFFADDLVAGEFQIVGSAVGTRDDVRETLELAVTNQLSIRVETCRLEDLNRVLDSMRRGELRARTVVTF